MMHLLSLPWKGAVHNVCWTMVSPEVVTTEACLGPICLLLLSTRWRRRKQPEEASLSDTSAEVLLYSGYLNIY